MPEGTIWSQHTYTACITSSCQREASSPGLTHTSPRRFLTPPFPSNHHSCGLCYFRRHWFPRRFMRSAEDGIPRRAVRPLGSHTSAMPVYISVERLPPPISRIPACGLTRLTRLTRRGQGCVPNLGNEGLPARTAWFPTRTCLPALPSCMPAGTAIARHGESPIARVGDHPAGMCMGAITATKWARQRFTNACS